MSEELGWHTPLIIRNRAYTIDILKSSGSETISSCDLSYLSPSGNYTWTTTGIYMDTVMNAAGCDSIITVDLTLNTVNTSVTNSDPMLSADATGATYQWIDCDNGNTPIAGETNQTFLPTTNGNYAVIVTENGCSDTSACESIMTVGLNDDIAFKEVTIYPNPSNGQFMIKFKNSSNAFNLRLVDSKGQIVYQDKNIFSDKSIDMSEQARGLYFLNVFNEFGSRTYKVIIH